MYNFCVFSCIFLLIRFPYASFQVYSIVVNMPPKFQTNLTKIGVKEKVKCHLSEKVMRFDELRDLHFPKIHNQTYKRPLDKGQSLLAESFQKFQKKSENQRVETPELPSELPPDSEDTDISDLGNDTQY